MSPVQAAKTLPEAGTSALIGMTVPAKYCPDPVPDATVKVNGVAGMTLYVAVTVALAAGIMTVVDGMDGVDTMDGMDDTQVSNIWPAGASFAAMATVVPAAYCPEPVPLVTVSVYNVGGMTL